MAGMFGEAGEHVGSPGLGATSLNLEVTMTAVHEGGALAAGVGAGERRSFEFVV